MTNKEYMRKALVGLNVSDDDIDIMLIKQGIDGAAQIDIVGCDLAIYNRFSVVLKGAMQNVSEGGYSISWNMEGVKLYYSALCHELGLENVLVKRPRIRNRSNMW